MTVIEILEKIVECADDYNAFESCLTGLSNEELFALKDVADGLITFCDMQIKENLGELK